MRILVLHPGALGDIALALPALGAIRRSFPDSLLTGFARQPVWKYSNLDIKTVDLEISGVHRLFSGPDSSVTGAADIVITWMGGRDKAFIHNLAASTGGRVLPGAIKPPPGARTHAAAHLMAPLAPLGIAPEIRPVPLIPAHDDDCRAADGALEESGVSDISETLLLHPGSGAPSKCWQPGKFAEIAQKWVDKGRQAMLIEGPADADAVSEVLEIVKLPVYRGAKIGTLISMLGRCKAYLGNDSGVTHLAAASGARAVALFGPTDPRVWGPVGPHVEIIAAPAIDGIETRQVWKIITGR